MGQNTSEQDEVKKEKSQREIEEERAEEMAKAVIHYAKCGECGVSLPVEQLADNGSYLVCPKCL